MFRFKQLQRMALISATIVWAAQSSAYGERYNYNDEYGYSDEEVKYEDEPNLDDHIEEMKSDFRKQDTNGDNMVDVAELTEFWRQWTTEERLQKVVDSKFYNLDTDRDMLISMDEAVQFLKDNW